MRKLFVYLAIIAMGCFSSCGRNKYEETAVPTVEEIPVEIATNYQPNYKEVIRICIPHDSIGAYSDTGEAPKRLEYQINKNTTNVYLLKGLDSNNNYVYELLEE